MPLSHKPIERLTEEDVQGLIEGAAMEGRRIEYKRELPGNRDEDKREFLADATSFANASGGDIIYGLDETEGSPSAISAIENVDPDQEILRLESLLQSSVQPRIPGVHMRAVPLSTGGHVFVLRIPQSWVLPHMVTYRNLTRFYSRNSGGKYPLDVHELRALFAQSGDVAERLRRFRDDRLARIVAGEGAFPVPGPSYLVLHVLPLRVFDSRAQVDLDLIDSAPEMGRPLRASGYSRRYNLDGLAVHSVGPSTEVTYSYTQIFRNGAIEAVEAGMLAVGRQNNFTMPADVLGYEIADSLSRFLRTQAALGMDLPIVVLVTLLGVKGFRMPSGFLPPVSRAIERDVVQLPELVVDDWSLDVRTALRPIFDTLWNSAGIAKSTLYDANGDWKVR